MKIYCFFIICLILQSCSHNSSNSYLILKKVNIIDQNGFTETISQKERLEEFKKTDFLSPQPYQKILRIFSRDKNGTIPSIITTYHPNGKTKQYLELSNSRAIGKYFEWHSNGTLKLEAFLMGGPPDITEAAQKNWIFDKESKAYNENGILIASIPYKNGEISGEAKYYYDSGELFQVVSFNNSIKDGVFISYYPSKIVKETSRYSKGDFEGISKAYWPDNTLCYKENYSQSRLTEAEYFDQNGSLIFSIHNGVGYKVIYNDDGSIEKQEYSDGYMNGGVEIFNSSGHLTRTYHKKNGVLHGLDITYYPSLYAQSKLQVNWYEGSIHGMVKTWYENGQLQSQKEMNQNKKIGLLLCWYNNGSLMLVEEYDNDNLIKGDYYQSKITTPVSRVENGKGRATLFDPYGNILKRISYENGRPEHS